jgi:hypothetical protein
MRDGGRAYCDAETDILAPHLVDLSNVSVDQEASVIAKGFRDLHDIQFVCRIHRRIKTFTSRHSYFVRSQALRCLANTKGAAVSKGLSVLLMLSNAGPSGIMSTEATVID